MRFQICDLKFEVSDLRFEVWACRFEVWEVWARSHAWVGGAAPSCTRGVLVGRGRHLAGVVRRCVPPASPLLLAPAPGAASRVEILRIPE